MPESRAESDDSLSPREARRELRGLWTELARLKDEIATVRGIIDRIEISDRGITFLNPKE